MHAVLPVLPDIDRGISDAHCEDLCACFSYLVTRFEVDYVHKIWTIWCALAHIHGSGDVDTEATQVIEHSSLHFYDTQYILVRAFLCRSCRSTDPPTRAGFL